jgi:hypothetical protein
MGFPYGPNTRHPIQLWVWFALHFDNDKQPVNVRCARSNGLSLSASPLLSLTLSGGWGTSAIPLLSGDKQTSGERVATAAC